MEFDLRPQAILGTIVLFLLILKLFYFFVVDRNHGKQGLLRNIVYVLNTIYLITNLISVYLVLGGLDVSQIFQYQKLNDLIFGFICICSFIIIILNWISIVENSLEVRNGMLLSKRAMVLFIIYLVPNLALVIACCVIEVQSDHEQPYLETITRVYGFFLCSTTSLIMFLIWIFLFIHYFKLPDYSKKKHFFFFISSLIFSITVLGVVFSLFVIEWNLSCFFGYLGFSVTMLYELELVFLLFQVDKDILIKFFHPNYSPPATSNISNSTGAIKDEITDGGATTGNIEA